MGKSKKTIAKKSAAWADGHGAVLGGINLVVHGVGGRDYGRLGLVSLCRLRKKVRVCVIMSLCLST